MNDPNKAVEVDPNLIISELISKVNRLTYEGIMKDAYIKQLKSQIPIKNERKKEETL